MGLDAYVNCNCYKEGKAKPFPFPELEQHLGMNEDGFFGLLLDLDDYQYEHEKVLEWQSTACEHPDMDYVVQHIGNWTGYRYFQQALEDIGWVYFPTLYAELPASNDGFTTPDKATIMLEELDLFRDLIKGREMPFLVNTKTNTVLHSYVSDYEGVFMWAGKENICLGIDPDGFFIAKIRKNEDAPLQKLAVDRSQIFFRAMRFEQRLMDVNEHGIPQKVEYYDADTENRYFCETAFSAMTVDEEGNIQREFPRLLHVETRAIDASEYAYQLNALETVCKASIETGNPIVWC